MTGFAAQVSSLERICWTCGLCFDTAEELVEHRRTPEYKHVHDRKYVDEFHESTNLRRCHWCCMGFPSAIGHYSHEMTDLIHWGNVIRGYRYEGLVEIQCKRCAEHVFINRWRDHERFGLGHNCCHVCELDFPHVEALESHIQRFEKDGRHDWVCLKKECRTVCCGENELKDHCSAWAEHRGDLCDEHASFQCEYCKKILGDLPLWREHTKTAHPGMVREYELRDEKRNEEENSEENSEGWVWKWYKVVQGLEGCEIT